MRLRVAEGPLSPSRDGEAEGVCLSRGDVTAKRRSGEAVHVQPGPGTSGRGEGWDERGAAGVAGPVSPLRPGYTGAISRDFLLLASPLGTPRYHLER